jgi:competence ComEA-like helix-hairpin-helix protein
MTPSERRALLWVAGILLLAAGVRHQAEAGHDHGAVGSGLDLADSLLSEAEAKLYEDQVRARPVDPADPLDLNQVDGVHLDRLPGVGPALAERIVADRTLNGPFRRVEDLLRVPGIGPVTLARIRPLVRVR